MLNGIGDTTRCDGTQVSRGDNKWMNAAMQDRSEF